MSKDITPSTFDELLVEILDELLRAAARFGFEGSLFTGRDELKKTKRDIKQLVAHEVIGASQTGRHINHDSLGVRCRNELRQEQLEALGIETSNPERTEKTQ